MLISVAMYLLTSSIDLAGRAIRAWRTRRWLTRQPKKQPTPYR